MVTGASLALHLSLTPGREADAVPRTRAACTRPSPTRSTSSSYRCVPVSPSQYRRTARALPVDNGLRGGSCAVRVKPVLTLSTTIRSAREGDAPRHAHQGGRLHARTSRRVLAVPAERGRPGEHDEPECVLPLPLPANPLAAQRHRTTRLTLSSSSHRRVCAVLRHGGEHGRVGRRARGASLTFLLERARSSPPSAAG